MNENINIDNLVDFIDECAEYIYNWASSYTGKYTPIDHSRWYETFLLLGQEYHFDLAKIKKCIKDGKIILPTFINRNPKFTNLYPELYKVHKEKVKEFEEKYKLI